MSNVALVVCTWLHLIATVVWIGHMGNSAILFAPLSQKYVQESAYGDSWLNTEGEINLLPCLQLLSSLPLALASCFSIPSIRVSAASSPILGL